MITMNQLLQLDRMLTTARDRLPISGLAVEIGLVQTRELLLDAVARIDAMLPPKGPPRCECPAPCPQHPERNPPKGRT